MNVKSLLVFEIFSGGTSGHWASDSRFFTVSSSILSSRLEESQFAGVLLLDKIYYEHRKAVVDGRKKAGDNPYPHKFQVTPMIEKYYDTLEKGCINMDCDISLAGRILKRTKYGKLVVYHMDVDGKIFHVMADSSEDQILNRLRLGTRPLGLGRESKLDGAAFCLFRDSISTGDIVGVTGYPGRGKHGDLNIFPKDFKVLSHCLHLLLDNLKLQEIRYGKRFLDMIVNSEVRTVFKKRAKIITYIRKFLDDRDFTEVETSILSKVPGLGGAIPFVASNEKKMNFYMRIAPELALKQLIIGGMNRVYEIGKQFRSEDIDKTHHPEFTSCELYMAYSDYEDLMKLTEDLLSGIVEMLTGNYILEYKSSDGEEIKIDFTPPFRRIKMIEELENQLGIQIPRTFDEETTDDILRKACLKHDVQCNSTQRTARLLDKLADHFLGQTCINPTFIMNHPQFMSPWAKHHRTEVGLTERFELFVNKSELINAYTELNDPMTQREQLERLKKELGGLDDTLQLDETFLTALEYGLPPAAGWGIGIDRLVMLMTKSENIRMSYCFHSPRRRRSDIEGITT
ncbi:hypothetical protein OROGR_023297 [Orobanche gracilis]